ncbi:hypothetical protein ACH5RR_030758 [Cinchona calisaya]|uniref:Late embryogenesis abundant protein LEA-2 subgroup domain-containing protein n=1 Tax=Cinchona calisaya TaxID=153742 RepID=A0ABD2YYR2_9GENT
MNSQQEINPHFLPQPTYPHLQDQRPRQKPPQDPRHLHGQSVQPSPQLRDPPIAQGYDARHPHFQPSSQTRPEQQLGRHHVGQPEQRPPSLIVTPRKDRPIAGLIAACCILFWIIVIIAGLTVLIVYLVYRPRLPKFDISSATLNAAYLDMGYLLNADLTILGNFTNPNKKVNVDFSFVIMDLYYDSNLIATRYIDPFTSISGESKFEDIHMVSSQVRLPLAISQDLTKQMNNGRVNFDVKGLFRARSILGGVLKYSYWLYSHCAITVTGPPTGILIAKKCTTKR